MTVRIAIALFACCLAAGCGDSPPGAPREDAVGQLTQAAVPAACSCVDPLQDCPNPPVGACYSFACVDCACETQPKQSGTPCQDAAQCIVAGAGHCDATGTCLPNADPCVSSNPCLERLGTCRASAGSYYCAHLPKPTTTPCTADSNPCTINEHCNGEGSCVSEQKACTSPPNARCWSASGTCRTADGVCVYERSAVGSSCELDGDRCTLEACNAAGECVFASNKACAPATACKRAGVCNPADGNCQSAQNRPDGTVCDTDSSACTVESCSSGNCRQDRVIDCDPRNACKTGVCLAASGLCDVRDKAAGSACSDGVVCTDDACDGAGVCVSTPKVCNSPPPCHKRPGWCDPTGQCRYDPDEGAACDDNALCTLGDRCDASGVCRGTPRVCDEPPAAVCYQNPGTCNAGTGACEYPKFAANTPCDDANPCTTNEKCTSVAACVGTYSFVSPQCHLDPGASQLTASPNPSPAGGAPATVTLRPRNALGNDFPASSAQISCDYGIESSVQRGADGTFFVTLEARVPGVATCRARADGSDITAPLAVNFTGIGLRVRHAASQTTVDPGQPLDLVASIDTADSGETAPGIELAIRLPPFAGFVPGSARAGGMALTARQEADELRIALPPVPPSPNEVRVLYQLQVHEDGWGEAGVEARAVVAGVDASPASSARFRIGASFQLGGCGCSAAGPSGGALLALVLLAWGRRARGGSARRRVDDGPDCRRGPGC